MTVLSLLPQVHFWCVRGGAWNGVYTVLQPDELLYSAYVNALVDGRPRRNDPASGRDDHPREPMQESLFSIQFIPPYFVALPARTFRISTSTAFIILIGAAAFFSSLSLFWLLASVIGEFRTAGVGVIAVLCLGTLAGGQGVVGLLLNPDVKFLGLPFLRNYQPSASFPLFFVFCALLFLSLRARNKLIIKSLLAGLIFTMLLFSYFYLWTAALAWLGCLIGLWLLIRFKDKGQVVRTLIIAGVPIVVGLIGYVYLVSKLPFTADRAWISAGTHRPDLMRVPEIIGAILIGVNILAVRRGQILLSNDRVIFAMSFAIFPLLIFNQQVLTGRSIQPFHYEVLIANYAVLVGAVITFGILRSSTLKTRLALVVAFGCLLWATLEVGSSISAHYNVNANNDEAVPVLIRLREYAKYDGTWDGLRNNGKAETLVFSPEYRLSGVLPTWAPQGTLLATGSAAFQNKSSADLKRRLYEHLYYCGRGKDYLRDLLNARVTDSYESYYVKTIIFGPERQERFLETTSQTIRPEEIESEVASYDAFLKSIINQESLKYELSYAIVSSLKGFDFSWIDKWYERDRGEQVGSFTLYHLKKREVTDGF